MLRQLALSAAILTATATAVGAGQCGYDYCWGAVGIATNGNYGWSNNWGSESQAIQAAQDGCSGQCTTIKTFYNTCGSISVADNGAWGWGWHSDLDTAHSISMNYCMDNGYNCQPRVWACSY